MDNTVKIEWAEKKSNDWIVASISKGESPDIIENVSINRTNQKGEVFPDFDKIMTGHTLQGTFWTSLKGKHYLFAPKPATGASGGSQRGSAGGIKAAQERKETSINKSMDRKEESIALASSMRDATLISTTLYKDAGMSDDEFKVKWRSWQKWLFDRFEEGSDPTNKPAF